MAQDNKDFTLEDILAEQREMRQRHEAPAPEAAPQPAPAPQRETPAPAPQRVPQPQEDDGAADLNDFAAAPVEVLPEEEEPAPPKGRKNKKEKKKGRGLFGRKKRAPQFDENEDDPYYGLQLKPIDEYRMGYDSAGELTSEEEAYKTLFDDSRKAIDQEVEQNFQRLQKERRRRVAEAVQTAGVDAQQVADEFGIVAPMPVTAFAADPYARQHGIGVEGGKKLQSDMADIQKAMLETSSDQTMEIKLNVLNDTVELQRIGEEAPVSDEAISRVLGDGAPVAPVEAPAPQEAAQEAPPQKADEEEAPPQEPSEEEAAPQAAPAQEKTVVLERPQAAQPPQVQSIYEYRARGIPTHILHAEVLQSALLSESEELRAREEREERQASPRRRVRNKKLEAPRPEEAPIPDAGTGEEIDDYTGPEDAKSISHELRGEMRELTLRMTITGVCTALLALVNIIFGSQFSGGGDLGGLGVAYVVLTLVFLAVAVGVCYRTVLNGLKALFAFNANSDSAAAVATVAVAVQAVAAAFFPEELGRGDLHLYAVVVAAILFVNAAGKLTMIRRIHSNFRFVTNREQKYSVRVYDDHNTALKMAKDCVSETPVIAYQCRAGFLKRFLELSYKPDPSESSSQLLAPVGLIAGLLLCIAALLITRSVPAAISAFAAASCGSVAVSNMLAVNLPVSRLCRAARRAGAMVVGYEGVEQLGSVNAVMVDAEDLFPRGTVILNGIKTLGDRAAAEDAIMAASALTQAVGGPLAGVFEQVISENEDALPQVENFTYEDQGGIVGKVDGSTVAIGARALFINHQIPVPAREEESQYASGSQQVIYIGVNGQLRAMLVLTYNADRRRKNELQRLEDSGISVIVRTTDPNVTPQLIARLFGIDAGSVAVLDSRLGDEYKKLAGAEIPRADALVATKGRMESLLSVVSACVEERRTANLAVAIQTAAVVLCFVLVAFLACFGAMAQLSSLILFLFQLFWLVVVIVVPRLRR